MPELDPNDVLWSETISENGCQIGLRVHFVDGTSRFYEGIELEHIIAALVEREEPFGHGA